ncbi:MAG: hypothetical protein K940chlam2_01323 [Chlamydiae bacterium]|nr:hypothetical protein [Chlamydiota bacterium]
MQGTIYRLALGTYNLKLAQLFLNAGFDANQIYADKPPMEWAIQGGNMELIHLLEAQGISSASLYSKLLSHFYNVTGIHSEVNLEGACSWYINLFLSECLNAFKEAPDFSRCQIGSQYGALVEAFDQTDNCTPNGQEICQKIQRGELCFVNAGWDDHIISVTFSGDYMAICNRGQGSEKGTLRVYKIDRAKMTPELATKILKNEEEYEPRAHFYYNELPASLGGKEDKLTAAFKAIAPKFQKVGNCSLASQKAAIRFAWVMQLMAGGMPFAEATRVGRQESKAFTDFAGEIYP